MPEHAEPTAAEVAPADPQLPAVVTRVDGFIAAAIVAALGLLLVAMLRGLL